MAEDSSAEVRKLMMLISDLRAKDNERYEEHVKFMNEVVSFIKKISDNMNENWKSINVSLKKLNTTIETSLDTLLTGINPEGIKETSTSLKEIMDTMGKSMQSMNLENVMRELRALTGKGYVPPQTVASDVEAISGSFGSPYESVENEESPVAKSDGPEIYGYVPPHIKTSNKREKKKLRKPSQLFE